MAAPTVNVDVRSPIASYTPSIWEHTFTSFTYDQQVQEKYAEAIEPLKEEVRSMLMMAKEKTRGEKLILIDTLERLGVAYHFEHEIEVHLEQIFKWYCGNVEEEGDDDLFITSLQFRLLRQHHHYISCSVFDKFTDKDNKFKETLITDSKGLLSLYEAAHLRIHGEYILDEAVAFTTPQLKHMAQQSVSSPFRDQVERALALPLHRASPRIETRHYISFYEKDDSKNETLLRFAKLDFNHVQNMYKKELHELSRWWNELKSELPYIRNRVPEAYLWGLTFQYKPQHSYARVGVTKTIQMLTCVDDTYDNYATVDEADLFTEAVQRWNIDEIDRLPDYMKIIYRLILRVYDDYEKDAAEQGKLFVVPYAKQTVKDVCTAYNKELKWFMRVEATSFRDYMINSTISGCFYAICAGTISGMKPATKETIEWLRSEPKLITASSNVCRYIDDLSGYERESNNGQLLTGVDFYMKQHGASLQETFSKFIELTEDAWKDLNTEWIMAKDPVPTEMLEQVLGYARSAEIFYRSCQDGYTKTEVMAPHISALFVEPITI